MSVESISLVLNHSRAKGTAKLVLVGIANHDGDGGAWPTIATLARYANTSERSVQRAIADLVELGEVVVHANAGGTFQTPADRRPNRYSITVTRAVDNSADGVTPVSPRDLDGVTPVTRRGDASVANGVTPVSPEPSLNRPENRPLASEAREAGSVDGRDGVTALRAALAEHHTLNLVGGWARLTDTDRVAINALVATHGVARLVAAVADSRTPPRSVRAFLNRWDDLPEPVRATARPTEPTCTECHQPETTCRRANSNPNLDGRHDFTTRRTA